MSNMNRRRFLKKSGALLAAGTLPLSVVELAFGKNDPNTRSASHLSQTRTSRKSRETGSSITGIGV